MATTPSNQEKIQKLHQQLVEARHKRIEQRDLHEQLELIEMECIEKTDELEQLRRGRRGQEGDPIEEKVVLAEQALNAVLAQKQQIDDRLDGIGEDIEEEVEALEVELVHALLETYPDRRAEYEQLADQVDGARGAFEILLVVLEQSDVLLEHLEAALTLRHKRRRGLLEMLFSRNPRSLLSLHLQNTCDLCEEFRNDLDALEPPAEATVLQEQLAELTELLNSVMGCCPEVYSQRQFDLTFPSLKRQLEELLERMRVQCGVTEQQLQDGQAALDAWLESKARG